MIGRRNVAAKSSVGLNHDRLSVLIVTNPCGYIDAATDWFKNISSWVGWCKTKVGGFFSNVVIKHNGVHHNITPNQTLSL
jgi:hypothetical protein